MSVKGIVRRVDDLGRIVLPREVRKSIGIFDGDPLEILIDDQTIILRKVDESLPAQELLKRTLDLIRNDWGIKTEIRNSVTEKLQEAIVLMRKSGGTE